MLLGGKLLKSRYLRVLCSVLVFCFTAPVAQAQLTTVTGTVTDANGIPYAGATIKAQLTLSGVNLTGQPTVTNNSSAGCKQAGFGNAPCQIPFQGTNGPITLDPTGSFTLNLQDNSQVTPASTQWLFTVNMSSNPPPLGTGPQACAATLTISGASQSISSSFAACPKLSNIGGGSGGSGGGGTPPTQAGGNCIAPAVSPGQVCAGPVPTSTGQNPTFETSFINSIAGSATITVSGAPLVNVSSALLTSQNDPSAIATVTPAGFSTIENSTSFQLYTQTLSSTAQITPSITLGSSTNQWANLIFVGGNVSSTPVHTATAVTATCPEGASSNCASITPGSAVSSSNMLLIVGRLGSSGSISSTSTTISDTLGNTYIKVGGGVTTSPGTAAVVWMVQNPIAGTPTILINGHETGVLIGGCCKMYELSGATAYYLGATGPPSFRYLTAQDLIGAGIIPGLVAFAHTTLGANATVTGSATSVLTVTLRTPASGCPCRADIRYSGWANFAGVTNEPDIDFWVSDGTNNMVPFTSGQSNASTGATTTVSASGYSPITYPNNTSVTFTLKGIVSSANAGTIQFVYQAAQPTGGSAAPSYLDVGFISSN